MSTITYIFSGEIKKKKKKKKKKKIQKKNKTTKKKTKKATTKKTNKKNKKKKKKQKKKKKKNKKKKTEKKNNKNKTTKKNKQQQKTKKQKQKKKNNKTIQCLVLRSGICDTLQCLFVALRPHYVFFCVLRSCASQRGRMRIRGLIETFVVRLLDPWKLYDVHVSSNNKTQIKLCGCTE